MELAQLVARQAEALSEALQDAVAGAVGDSAVFPLARVKDLLVGAGVGLAAAKRIVGRLVRCHYPPLHAMRGASRLASLLLVLWLQTEGSSLAASAVAPAPASAPAPAAMLHAGVLKKFGLYGLLRLALPMTPLGWKEISWVVGLMLAANILYLGFASLAQRDLRWLLGFSSAMHMGTVFLGLIGGTVLGLGGALVLIIGHGLSAALGFAVAGEIGNRTGTTWMQDLGGLAQRAPKLWFYLLVAGMASIGLPGMANFAGEIMIFFGSWSAHPFLVVAAAWGVVLSSIAMLRAIRSISTGACSTALVTHETADLKGAKDVWPFALLTFFLFAIGLIPNLILGPARPVLERIFQP